MGIDLMAATDPLSALINGLVSKCGIDESEVANIETQINDEKAKDSNSNSKATEKKGVTTIGFASSSAQKGEDGEEEEVHEIMVVKKRRKRKLEETDMGKKGVTDEATTTAKKMKLNTGSAMMVDSAKEKVEEK